MVGKYFSSTREEIQRLYKSVLTKGSFAQNFAFTFSGKAIGILSQLIFAPIIARIYGPEAYGVYAVFNALATNLALVSTLRLEGALVLPKEEEEFQQLLKTVFLISFIFSLLISTASLIGKDVLIYLLRAEGVGDLFYALGPFVFLICAFQITGNWAIRKKAFKDAFHYGVPIGIGVKAFNVLYGFLTKGASHGLILADAVMRVASLFIRFKFILKSGTSFLSTPLDWTLLKKIVKKYKQFPLFDMPGNWINMFSNQLPIYMLTLSFGANPVGQFGFAISLLDMPMGMLGNTIAPVFLQKVTETFHKDPKDIGRITTELYKKLLFVGVLPFAFITVFGDVIFKLIFGQSWVQAGVFTGYLGFFYLFRLISAPMTSIFVILNKQNKFIYFNLFLLIGRAVTLTLGLFLLKDVIWAVLLFSIFNSIAYLLLSIWILKLVKAQVFSLTFKTFVIISVTFIALYIIKSLII